MFNLNIYPNVYIIFPTRKFLTYLKVNRKNNDEYSYRNYNNVIGNNFMSCKASTTSTSTTAN